MFFLILWENIAKKSKKANMPEATGSVHGEHLLRKYLDVDSHHGELLERAHWHKVSIAIRTDK